MPPAPRHIIGTHAIQMRVEREASARALMEQASALFRARLAVDAEALFSARCPAGVRVQLDRLELRLGTIAEEHFEAEFPARFRAALAAELDRRLPPPDATDDEAGAVRSDVTLLEVLEHVLLHGYLPWWAPVEPDFAPADELAAELLAEPAAVAALARKIGRHRRVRFRLVRWLDDPHLAALIRAVAAGDAEFVLRYAADLQARQEEEPLVAASAEEFRHAKWEVILAHLLADRGSRFNTKAFLRLTLHDLAGQFRFGYAALLAELARVARSARVAWREASLPQLLNELFVEDVEAPGGASATAQEQQWLAEWAAALAEPPERWTAARQRVLRFWSDADARQSERVLARLVARFGRTRVAAACAALADRNADPTAARLPPELELLLGEASADLRDTAAARSAADAGSGDVSTTAPATPGAEGTHPPTAERGFSTESRAEADKAAATAQRRLIADLLRELPVTLSPEQQAAFAAWRAATRPVGRGGATRGDDYAAGREAPGSEATDALSQESDALLMPALRQLLETGTLPSAAWTIRWRGQPLAWLEFVLVHYAEAVPPLLRAWSRAGKLTAALPEHFDDATLETLVAVVEPAHADEVAGFVRTATHAPTLRDEPQFPPSTSAERFRRSVWAVVFDYLLSDHGSVFNAQSFLEHSIQALAARHRLETSAVFEHLVRAAQATGRHPLLRDLRAVAERCGIPFAGEAGFASSGAPLPPAARDTPGRGWTAERLRVGSLARLQLLRLVLDDATELGTASLERLLPLLWELLAQPSAGPWRELLRERSDEPRSIDRILATGGERCLAAAVFAGEPAQAEAWERALAWLEQSPAAEDLFPGGRHGLRARLWRALLDAWRRGGGRPIRDVIAWLAQLLTEGSGNDGGAKLARALARDPSVSASRLAVRVPGAWRERAGADTEARSKAAPEPDAAEAEEPPAPPPVDEPIAVTNAGLVLLAPYLPRLHRQCGLLDGDVFRNFEANQIAVHLLQYLVTGGARVRGAEFSLVLNKVLCGLEPAAAVVPRIELDPKLTAIAEGLLGHVAGQWPRGAKLSVEGLRSTYLHRPGRLKRRADGIWALKVEARGWDVLLGELPWSFGRVHAPWMPAPLEVDWV